MTPSELKELFRDTLLPQRTISQEYSVLDAIVDFVTSQNTDIIPDWNSALIFQSDGTDAGKYCKYPDTNSNKRIFETLIDDNIGNAPPTDPDISSNAYWQEVSASSGSGIQEWSAGVYGLGLVVVYHNHSTEGRGLYVLIEGARPFTSSDIESETIEGKWQALTRQYIDEQISALKDGVPSAGDTLKKLYDLIQYIVNRSPQAFSAAGGAFPTTYAGNSIQAGDSYRITVAGTLGSSNQKTVNPEDLMIALVDAPTNNGNDWQVVESNRDQATEALLGLMKVATQPMVTAGTDDTSAITSKKLKDSTYLDQSGSKLSATASGTNTYTASLIPALTSYSNTQRLFIKFTNANTGAATINIDGLGAKAIKKNVGNDLVAGDIVAGGVYILAYDGTNFQLLAQAPRTLLLNDVKLQNQIESGKKVLCMIDTDGTIKKVAEAEYNSTLKKWTFTGSDNSGSTSSARWQNQSFELILELFNDKVVKFGGDSAIIEVNQGVQSGNAAIRCLVYTTGAGIGFRFQDEDLNDYIQLRTLTTDRGVVIRQPVEYNFGQGELRITRQFSLTLPNTTASQQHVIFEFTLSDYEHYDIKVLHSDATALQSEGSKSITSLGIDCADVRKIPASNIEGNTSISTQSRLPSTVVSGGFNWNIDTANQKIQYRFQNAASPDNGTYTVWVEVSYVKRITPSE